MDYIIIANKEFHVIYAQALIGQRISDEGCCFISIKLLEYFSRDELSRPGSFLALARDLAGSIEGPSDLSTNKRTMEIDKREYYLIGALLAFLIPLMVGVLFWWTVASVDIFSIMTIPEGIMASAAITGLAIGIVLDIIYLRKWIIKFYEMNRVVSILLYLFCSLMAVAFFMGIPGGNLLLGFLAGIYFGRKHHYLKTELKYFGSPSKNVSLFSAFVTGIEALPIGLLALREVTIIDSINRIFGFVLFNANKITDVIMILILCSVLFGIQYFVTRVGAILSFKKFGG